MQKKKTEAAAHGMLTVGSRSNFAEFRRQMKLKQKSSSSSAAAAAADNDEVRSSPRRSASQSPAPTTPRQQLSSSGIVSLSLLQAVDPSGEGSATRVLFLHSARFSASSTLSCRSSMWYCVTCY